jgi:hypothetical protein
MPTDPTTAEKAERLGLHRTSGSWLDASGMPRAWRGKRAGQWYRSGARGTTTEAEAIDALYAEQFPTPDYRAALEALVGAGDAVAAVLIDHDKRPSARLADDLRAALTHARKVLHGQ